MRSELGVGIWALVIAGALTALLPAGRISRLGLIFAVLLLALSVWTGLAILWSDSAERTAVELARVTTLAGVFALGLMVVRGPADLRKVVGAIGAAIGVISVAALGSRFLPDLFGPDVVAQGLPAEADRLNYPLTYWNGLAALVAMGAPICLWAAADARRLVLRAAATAILPAFVLTVYYTLSRGGAVELLLGVAVLLALHPRRLALVAPLTLAAIGSAVLIWGASGREALADGLVDTTAKSQGLEMLAITLAVMATIAVAATLIQGAIQRDQLVIPSPQVAIPKKWIATAAAVTIVAGVALGAPGEVSDRWEQFKTPATPGGGSARLANLNGSGRVQWWESAIDANASAPILGIGPGSWEYWWARGDGGVPGFVRDAHSLYLEMLGELGIPGLILILALVLGLVGVSASNGLRARDDTERTALHAAATAALAVFAIAAAIDWVWELTVLPAAFLLIGAAAIRARESAPEPHDRRTRVALVAVGVLAVATIVPPMLNASAIKASKDAVDDGDAPAALANAQRAESVLPFSAEASLQQAQVLQLAGELDAAREAAIEATEEEPVNWRNWFALAEIEEQRGDEEAAAAAAARARQLNPRSTVLNGS